MDQVQAVENYRKLQNYFVETLKFFNLDYFNRSKRFRLRNLFFIIVLMISYYFNIDNVIKTFSDKIKMVWTYNLCWFIVHFMVLAKTFTFVYNKRQYLALLEEIGELYSAKYSNLVLMVQQNNLKANFRLTIAGLVAYATSLFVGEFVALSYYINIPGVCYPVLYHLPLYPDRPLLHYTLNMIIQFIIYFIVISILCFGDHFVIFFGLHFRCELKTISELTQIYLNDSTVVATEKYLLKEIYKKHLKVLKMLKILDDIYRIFSFNQILSSFICLCFVFYGSLVQDSFEWTFYFFIVLTAAELFIYCLFGETLVANTEQIGTSIYLTKWYEMSVEDQRNLLFIMRIAQKPRGIKAAGLIHVNFTTFVEILKGAASYCLILYSLTT
ncbi:putative odorant receptor 83c [Lutzomyia longipalpis]|uniref:putative odorant receptor 83c n=1 Tax=Lutzomyia longipalpis TaxID=7200 RepID=UPI002483B310|nr:putative odorant receptor 83c [Lutzomyia longipalpis]